jgi:hypothetical protein
MNRDVCHEAPGLLANVSGVSRVEELADVVWVDQSTTFASEEDAEPEREDRPFHLDADFDVAFEATW